MSDERNSQGGFIIGDRVEVTGHEAWCADWYNETLFVAGIVVRPEGGFNVWLSQTWPVKDRGDLTDDFRPEHLSLVPPQTFAGKVEEA